MLSETVLSVVLNILMLAVGASLVIKGVSVRKAARPIGNTASSNQTSISTTYLLVGAMLVVSQLYGLLERLFLAQ